jgi:hypothetical protein
MPLLIKNNRQTGVAEILVITICLLTCSQVSAEGAVRTFQCSTEKRCDSAGSCVAAESEVEFRMEPVQLDAEGAGSYKLSYQGNVVAMEAGSDAGPFLWEVVDIRHTLLVNSGTTLLWHSLDLDSLTSNTLFMQCTLQQ